MGVEQCGKWDERLGQVNRQMLQCRWLLGELGVQRAEGRGQKACFQVLSAPVPTSKPAAQEYSACLYTNTRAFTSIVH